MQLANNFIANAMSAHAPTLGIGGLVFAVGVMIGWRGKDARNWLASYALGFLVVSIGIAIIGVPLMLAP